MSGLSVEQLHGDEPTSFLIFALLEDPDNAGMVQLAEGLKFPLEALDGWAGEVETLEREPLVGDRILDLKDLSGPATRDGSNDWVLANGLSAHVVDSSLASSV